MKKLLTSFALFAALLFCSTPAQGQTININIQPSWGPVGYDYAEFYYIPELNIYYDVVNSLYYYLSGGAWIGRPYLPVKYKRYNLHDMYKVVLNGTPRPWLYNKQHRREYKHFINDRTQTPIRHSVEPKYEPARRNTQPWVDNQPKNVRRTPTSDVRNNNPGPSRQIEPNREGGVRQEEGVRREEPVRSNSGTERRESDVRRR